MENIKRIYQVEVISSWGDLRCRRYFRTKREAERLYLFNDRSDVVIRVLSKKDWHMISLDWIEDQPFRYLYRNIRCENKYIEVVRYRDGHYYIAQYMRWGNVVNYMGCRGKRRMHRVSKRTLKQILEDYYEIDTY